MPVPLRMVKAKMKSPQPARNAKTATVMTAERASGITTRRNARHSDAPSTLAASMSSFGRLKKNARNTRMAKGIAYVPSARMSPGYEFSKWIQWKTMNSEVARTIEGTIWATSRELTTTTVTRRRYFESAYAAGTATTRASSAVPRPTRRLVSTLRVCDPDTVSWVVDDAPPRTVR